ncbi:kin of IRRE-like protein 2 [Eriocheir sinensis]|uniref:kin of IRRE-like protein 2 n=1 Tax=Eriocheir sinensis TaxID=95602 RepID=UPI0021C85D2B|nr:kin of IRRE-like protein 2 [Eriocheir sinensis]
MTAPMALAVPGPVVADPQRRGLVVALGKLLPLHLTLLALTCTGVWGQSQVFREVPRSVRVKAGEDVLLRCAVANQQGRTQWTKDGFALGFERGVPGYPRYLYLGEASRGEHHLVIKGATLEDDGEYQCQVGPTDTTPPIWAAANLTVMVSPSSISIAGVGDGGVVEVEAGHTLRLECLVKGARPPASVTWYRDAITLSKELHREEVILSQGAPGGGTRAASGKWCGWRLRTTARSTPAVPSICFLLQHSPTFTLVALPHPRRPA